MPAGAGTVVAVVGWNLTSLSSIADGELARAVADDSFPHAGEAETELYRRFAPRVRLYGLRHLRDRSAADDLAQQVLLVVLQRLRAGEVRDPDQIGSFILGTSRMMATNATRSERRREQLRERFDVGDERQIVWTNELALDEARVVPCLAGIRERERTVLVLTFYADRTAPQIAEALGMTPGAVRIARHRALASMRNCLGGQRPS